MAKMIIEFDTQTKAMTVTKDGQAVPNVKTIDLYASYDDPEAYRFQLMAMDETQREADGYVYQTCIYAKDSSEGLKQSADATVEGDFVKVRKPFFPSLRKLWRK